MNKAQACIADNYNRDDAGHPALVIPVPLSLQFITTYYNRDDAGQPALYPYI